MMRVRRAIRGISIAGPIAFSSALQGQSLPDTVSDDFRRAPSLADALIARYPGVSVLYSSGMTGAGSSVRLRGASAVHAPNEPLLMIDGVWVHGSSSSMTLPTVAGAQPSRLDDFDPDDVERIEILPGPAAAAVYGMGAARGVIRISTRRRTAGRRRVSAFVEGGVVSDAADYPTNYTSTGTPTPAGDPRCFVPWQATGSCTLESLGSWNAIERASPYRTGSRLSAGARMMSTNNAASYALSASHDRDGGVYAGSEAIRTRARVHATRHVSGIDLSLAAAYATGVISFPGGAGQTSMLGAGLLGPGADDPVYRGYDPLLREVASRTRSKQDFDHSTVAVHADWASRGRWSARATIGVDDARRDETQQVPQVSPDGIISDVSDRFTAGSGHRTLTAATAATMTIATDDLRAVTTLALDHRRERQAEARARTTPPPPPEWCQIVPSLCLPMNQHLRSTGSVTGLALQEELRWGERLHLGAGLRLDHGSVRGMDYDALVSTNLSVSYTAPVAAVLAPAVSSVRLHGAYGRAYDHRGFLPPGTITPFASNPFPQPDEGASPERINEVEGGLDIALFNGRSRLGFTGFRSETKGGIILVPRPYSTGFRSVPANGLSVRTVGVEGAVHTRLFERAGFQWDMSLSGLWHDTRIERNRGGSSMGFGNLQYGFVGHELVSYWGGASTYSDVNGDGMIEAGEVLVRADPTVEYGPSLPTTELGLRSHIRLFGALTAGVVLDYRGGHKMANLTDAARCATLRVCRENHDPSSAIEDQATAVIGRGGGIQGYVSDADFLKLREVSLTVRAPAAFARVVGASTTLTLVGRNLLTWTDYPGLDPEVTSGDAQSPARYDLFAQPLPRTLSARFDLAW